MEIPVRTREQVEDAVCKGLVDYMAVESYRSFPKITLDTRLGELFDSIEYTEACISIEEKLGLDRNCIDAIYADNTLNTLLYMQKEDVSVRDLVAFYYKSIENLPSTYRAIGIIGVDGSIN